MTKRYVVALLASLLLAGCASTPSSKSPTEIDYEYVNAVERHAGHAGVEVEWVNPPVRERKTEDNG